MSHWKHVQTARANLAKETGAIIKDPGGKLTIALSYPNSYRVGMSSLALHILYRSFNQYSDVACERAFLGVPAPNTETPLTLESQRSPADFNVWAFTISFEMDYFNVASMLARAGVPLLAEDRAEDDGWPLLIAGGPAVTMNPEPMAPFFDALVIGEAEAVLEPLIAVLRSEMAGNRSSLLDLLDAIPGIYVPQRLVPTPGGRRIPRMWLGDLAASEPVSAIHTPDTEFGGMQLMEIARGCGRGCRFCLAGHLYRPCREQPLERLLEWADRAPERRVGLVSASVSDYSRVDELADQLRERGARISVSSMRVDPISVPLVRAMAASSTKTLTIAPEAGTERLRTVINKRQTEDQLLAAVELAQSQNFPQLKMYFMIGHPTEEMADIDGIIDLTLKARQIFRRHIAINATPFVPKAHTPFQWMAAMPARTIRERQSYLERKLKSRGVAVDADSPTLAEVQAVLARGDRRLAGVFAALAERRPTAPVFREAMAAQGLVAQEFLSERRPDDFQPWNVVDTGIKPGYFARENALAAAGRRGGSCPPDTTACSICGVCVQPSLTGRVGEGPDGKDSAFAEA